MPFKTVAIDFITKLPISQGYDSILTRTDHDCTKAVIFIPCNEEISGEETATLYAKQVFAPDLDYHPKIISDRNPRFASKFTLRVVQIAGHQSEHFHSLPPTHMDGQSERFQSVAGTIPPLLGK
jgi:hypothetical protein